MPPRMPKYGDLVLDRVVARRACPDMAVPSATERKNSATIWVWKTFGASLVASDRLTGEISSSAMVKTKITPMSAEQRCGVRHRRWPSG